MKKLLYTPLLFMPLLGFSQVQKKPNIIIILADDLGWGDVGYHGSEIKTPNIDQLSKDGIILNRYYTAPICSPTRAGLLTGRYPNRLGIREATIPPWSDFGVDTSEVFIPQMLAEAGYKNRAIVGKWHLGHGELKYTPLRRGFTHFYGHYNGAINYFTHKREGELDWHNDYETSYDKGYSTDLLSDEAVKCIKKYSKESPFFLYVAYNAPHGPWQAKKEDLLLYGYDETKPTYGKSDTGEDEDTGEMGHGNTKRQTYSAMVTCMDRGIGRILQTLKNLHIDDNTIVLFHSDNGAPAGGPGDPSGSNGKLRGYKFNEWEGGVRVPAIIKWPAQLKGGQTNNQVMGYIDVMPTLKEIVGIKTASKKPLDGISMLPILKGNVKHIDREFYLGHGALISNDWKLIKANSGNKTMKITEDQLFAIPSDYIEKNNIKNNNEQVYQQLLKVVAPYDAIKAKKELLSKGNKNGWIAPKEYKITKE